MAARYDWESATDAVEALLVEQIQQLLRPAGELLQNLEGQSLSPSDRISGAVGFVLGVMDPTTP